MWGEELIPDERSLTAGEDLSNLHASGKRYGSRLLRVLRKKALLMKVVILNSIIMGVMVGLVVVVTNRHQLDILSGSLVMLGCVAVAFGVSWTQYTSGGDQ